MKKENLRYVIIPLLLVIYLGYTQFISKQENEIVLYKMGFSSDCDNVKTTPKKAVVLTEHLSKDKLTPNNIDTSIEFEQSKCVKNTGYSLRNYLVMSDYAIDHIEGRNDTTYQIAYEQVLDALRAKDKHSDLDKQVIKSLEFYINDKDYKNLIPKKASKKDNFQIRQAIIGPDKTAVSGKYVLVVDLNVIVSELYKSEKKDLEKTEIVFDGLNMKYKKVGE